MNVKISNNKIRLKISDDELKELQAGSCVDAELRIGNTYFLAMIDPVGVFDGLIPELTIDPAQGGAMLRVSVSQNELQKLADLGRSREGLEQEKDGLSVSLQVDFRTQKRQVA